MTVTDNYLKARVRHVAVLFKMAGIEHPEQGYQLRISVYSPDNRNWYRLEWIHKDRHIVSSWNLSGPIETCRAVAINSRVKSKSNSNGV